MPSTTQNIHKAVSLRLTRVDRANSNALTVIIERKCQHFFDGDWRYGTELHEINLFGMSDVETDLLLSTVPKDADFQDVTTES